ncbi:type II secretion system F family protein [Novosphingobium umbonatum]|uniref:Type II secretion system F family protein n=1 Tax=Novosphingobium umbonatum TaxID=1908524 RepID=A0A3S2UPR5_9SPHN|nr:type II secretion system F family protein [Novosphingobium umbonatum]RVU03763.1 type II secretion system F family protein [Novosphingobium umbonatum]
MDIFQLLLITIGLAAGLGLVVLAMGGGSPDKESARRLQSLRLRHTDDAGAKAEAQLRKALSQRRGNTAAALADANSRTAALIQRLHRSGKGWTLQQFLQGCGGVALVVALVVWLKSGSLPLGLAVGLAAGAGIPHLALNYLISKRSADFNAKFADAIELIVRGLRSGLPVSETLSIISTEIPGPVGEEFKLVSERIRIGRTMDEALQETADRLAIPEFNFFCISLAIQRETGGNLAETLANLSDVLRKRNQMKLKIRAMSSESKASAYIVGALPFMVFFMIYMVNPLYLAGFFVDTRLIITGLGGLVWMGIGVFIMAKMVSFEI